MEMLRQPLERTVEENKQALREYADMRERDGTSRGPRMSEAEAWSDGNRKQRRAAASMTRKERV